MSMGADADPVELFEGPRSGFDREWMIEFTP